MARLFIADSEDEEEDVSPHSPEPVPLPPVAHSHSSDPLGRGTDSTDTAFFRSIYHEQTEAAKEHVRDEDEEAQEEARHTQLKRTPTEQEMWDVPSSPDPRPVSSRRKRRKLSNDGLSSPAQDGSQAPGALSTMLPPTLQIDNEAAFVITPSTMTKSQREEYQSIDYGSSVDREPISAIQTHGQRLIDLTSSSSGTNMNTPRTVGNLTQLPNTQDMPATAPYDSVPEQPPSETVQAPNSRPRRYSSPDVIAVNEPLESHQQYHEPTGDEEGAMVSAFSAKVEEESDEYQEPIIVEEDDSAFEEEPVKPKKKRGRPKKIKSKDSITQVKAESPQEPAKQAGPEPSGKKKRGRPRKSQPSPGNPSEQTTVEEPQVFEKDDETEEKITQKDNKRSACGSEASEDRTNHQQVQTEVAQGDESFGETHQDQTAQFGKSIEPSKAVDEKPTKIAGGKPSQIGVKEDGKPIYRVGLSKRTRIAPLLKVIRK
ncbi:hypothetical protein NLU13_3504 [Sarocladium strictum]|uniref:Uncharacterized protein n=1 Tax=Sarocladium strictum TaxID=5046 RepID=A0AA39GMG4_SARSR|nr:hypothetical protein NLU13_3504 [Sarocladium strictum]